MRKSFKFRFYPNAQQRQLLTSILYDCQQLYNAALEQRRDAWKLHKRSLSCYDQIKQLPELCKEFPEYKAIYSQILREPLRNLDKAFKAFFARIKRGEKSGFPRFRARDRYDSFTYPQAYNGSVKLKDNKVWLSKIGAIKIRKHREIEGKIKTATVKREGKHWYIAFSCDEVPRKVLPASDKNVGIDVGLMHFATFSTGKTVENPRHLKHSREKLCKAQQVLAAKKKGTSARRKAKERVGAIHRKISNQRMDFLHKLSRKIINEFGFIAVENLNIQQLLELKAEFRKQSNALHGSIADAAWGQFVFYLAYKAEEAGRGIVKVPARGTTKTCSKCGYVNGRLPLSQREFSCCNCGFHIDRDLNAAQNILRLGRSLARKRRSS